MKSNGNNYCVILAGGKGRRLWPCSRSNYPKQFVDFFGVGRTQLQQTFDRMAKIVPTDHIYINTNEEFVQLVKEQLPEVPAERILAEPIHRNTAPSMAWANHRISMLNPDACIIATPSDQAIFNEDAFRENVLEGLAFVAEHDRFLTMGVKPTRPEPGYGYIQMGEAIGNGLYKVQSFTEKPEREFAKIFVESGEFYWNTGLFLSNVKYLRECFTIAAIFARCIQQFTCGGFRLARRGCDPVWRNIQVEHPRLRCRPRRSAVLLRVYDRHGHWRVHQLPNPA